VRARQALHLRQDVAEMLGVAPELAAPSVGLPMPEMGAKASPTMRSQGSSSPPAAGTIPASARSASAGSSQNISPQKRPSSASAASTLPRLSSVPSASRSSHDALWRMW